MSTADELDKGRAWNKIKQGWRLVPPANKHMGSPSLKLNKEDGKKILKGLLVAVGGAVLTYLMDLVPMIDFGAYTGVAVAINSVLVNAARKWLTNYSSAQ